MTTFLSAGRSSTLSVLIPGTVDLTEQGGDVLPVFLHMEFQQPDDKTGDAAAAGGLTSMAIRRCSLPSM